MTKETMEKTGEIDGKKKRGREEVPQSADDRPLKYIK
jgi:hypothetical protein